MQGTLIVSQQPPRNLTSVKGMTIAQVVIGMMACVLGIVARASLSSHYLWTSAIGAGIWTGMWITVTGIIGLRSRIQYMNTNGNFTLYMFFNIISTCISGLAGGFFVSAVAFYTKPSKCYWYKGNHLDVDCNYQSIGLAMNIALLILMIMNLVVSIISAAYCCQIGEMLFEGQVIIQQPAVTDTQTLQLSAQGDPQYGTYEQPQYPPQPIISQYEYPSQQPNVMQQINVAYPEKPPEYSVQG